MERNQIVDTVHLIQREVGIDAVCPWRTVYEPSATDTAFELVPVECIRSVYEELKIIEFSPFSMADDFCRFIRVQFIQACIDTALFGTPEIDLPSILGIRCFSLVFRQYAFPFTKGKRGKANINIAVFD